MRTRLKKPFDFERILRPFSRILRECLYSEKWFAKKKTISLINCLLSWYGAVFMEKLRENRK